jgi:hypothetical protein
MVCEPHLQATCLVNHNFLGIFKSCARKDQILDQNCSYIALTTFLTRVKKLCLKKY